jgi:hypothetical protein
MLKRNITYVNPITKQEVTEEHYFHISKARMIEMQLQYQHEPAVTDPETGVTVEGYAARLQNIVNNKDGVGVAEVLKDFILRSYGRNVNNQFLRSPEISAEFEATEAFSQLFFEICMDAQKQAEFISSVFPAGMQEEVNKVVAEQAANAEEKTPPVPMGPPLNEGKPTDFAAGPPPDPPGTAPIRGPEPDRTTSPSVETQHLLTQSERRNLASRENPYILTRVEMVEMDSDELHSGLASGRYKLA